MRHIFFLLILRSLFDFLIYYRVKKFSSLYRKLNEKKNYLSKF